MMNYIWAALLLLAFVFALLSGSMQPLSSAVLSGAGDAVNLCIRLTAALCFWGGILRITQESGLASSLCRLLSPLLRRIFPSLERDSPAMKAMSMNIAANMLGLGNAATPLGLEAMRELDLRNHHNKTASREMVYFVVMNSAAFRLLPTTIAALRQDAGSTAPFSILPAAWVTSLLSLSVALLLTRVFLSLEKRYPKQAAIPISLRKRREK